MRLSATQDHSRRRPCPGARHHHHHHYHHAANVINGSSLAVPPARTAPQLLYHF